LIKCESEVTAMENVTHRIEVKRRAIVVGAGMPCSDVGC
jgi:hypothetical protein